MSKSNPEKETHPTVFLLAFVRSTHHGVSNGSVCGPGDPISITSPSPSPSSSALFSSTRCLGAFHRSTNDRPVPLNRNASRGFDGDANIPLPGTLPFPPPALPTAVVVACDLDNRLRITELARLTSDFFGPAPSKPAPVPVVVVNRAPADPGRGATARTPMCDDDECEGPRKCARACVGRDMGEWFDIGEGVLVAAVPSLVPVVCWPAVGFSTIGDTGPDAVPDPDPDPDVLATPPSEF